MAPLGGRYSDFYATGDTILWYTKHPCQTFTTIKRDIPFFVLLKPLGRKDDLRELLYFVQMSRAWRVELMQYYKSSTLAGCTQGRKE